MATDLDRALCGWPHEELMIQEDSEDAPLPQVLDHGSISFGRYAVESLAWEKRSAFTHDRRHEELEKLKSPGLVAKKKAYFEEYYKRLRAMKTLQVSNETDPVLGIIQEEGASQSNHSLEEELPKDACGELAIESYVDGVEAEVSARLGNLTVLDRETEISMNENATESLHHCCIDAESSNLCKDKVAETSCIISDLKSQRSLEGRDDETKDIGANHEFPSSVLLINGPDSRELKPSKAEHPSIDEDGISASEKLENLSSSLIVDSSSSIHQIEKVECREKSVAAVVSKGSRLSPEKSDFQMESSCNGKAASRTTTRMIKHSSQSKEKKNTLLVIKEPCDRLLSDPKPGKVSSEAPPRKSALFFTMQRRPATSSGVGDSLRPFSTKTSSVNMNAADSDKKSNCRGIPQVPSTSNGQIPLTGARGRLMQKAEPRYLPAVRKCKSGSEVNGDSGTRKRVLYRGASEPVAPPMTIAGTSNRPRKQVSSRHSDRQDGKKPRQELKPWR